MAGYDDVRFKYRMPDGFDGSDYQTKDFDWELDIYQVSPTGRLLLISAGKGNQIGDVAFDGVLNIYTSRLGTGWHEYDLEFQNGNLLSIYCHQTRERHIFPNGFSPEAMAVIVNTEEESH